MTLTAEWVSSNMEIEETNLVCYFEVSDGNPEFDSETLKYHTYSEFSALLLSCINPAPVQWQTYHCENQPICIGMECTSGFM